jgi:hypothetical protein
MAKSSTKPKGTESSDAGAPAPAPATKPKSGKGKGGRSAKPKPAKPAAGATKEKVKRSATAEANRSDVPVLDHVHTAAPPRERQKPPTEFEVGRRVVCYRHSGHHGRIEEIDGDWLVLKLDGAILVEDAQGNEFKTRSFRVERQYCRLTLEPGPAPTAADIKEVVAAKDKQLSEKDARIAELEAQLAAGGE